MRWETGGGRGPDVACGVQRGNATQRNAAGLRAAAAAAASSQLASLAECSRAAGGGGLPLTASQRGHPARSGWLQAGRVAKGAVAGACWGGRVMGENRQAAGGACAANKGCAARLSRDPHSLHAPCNAAAGHRGCTHQQRSLIFQSHWHRLRQGQEKGRAQGAA